jgi:MarR family transcriptional regulator, organic hydroperoxide resistance regulator
VTQEARLAEAVERLIAVVIRQRSAVPGPEPRQLTTTQALALLTVADEGPLRLGALADRIATTDATASRTVDVLERAGFVRRVPDPTDGRGISVEPTAEGQAEAARRRRRMAAMVGELLKGLGPDEQRRFVDLLDGLNELIVAADQAPVGV